MNVLCLLLIFSQIPRGEVKLSLEAIEDYGVYTKTEIIELKNLKASEVEPFISARVSKFGSVQVNDMLNALIITDYEPKLRDLISLLRELDRRGKREFFRLETEVIPVNFVQPSSIAKSLETRLSGDGRIQYNDDLNVLIVTDVQSKIEDVKRILGFLDVPPPQALIYVKGIEINEEYARELGLDVYGILGEVQISGQFKRGEYSEPTKRKIQSEEIYWSAKSMDLVKSIRQLMIEDKAELFSEFSLKLMNNREGSMSFEPYFGFKTVPVIGYEKDVTLQLTIFKKRTETEKLNGYYMKSEEFADTFATTVRLKEGDTLIIGGIKVENVKKQTSGVPVLKSVPILGYLFKKEIYEVTRKNLLLLLTVRIID